ncbi:MAG: DUF2437 domain-containing protein [SAR202 cluster bacterium]|nr:DUF2437 domain-containing protein [SAR202 cluster bacterium]
MKWCRFQAGSKVSYGVVEGGRVAEVDGSPFEAHKKTGKSHALDSVKLLIPCFSPTVYAGGAPNYVKHLEWANSYFGASFKHPKEAHTGYRASNAFIAHNENIVIPRGAKEVHYEGELVAVIGKKAKRVTPEQALDYVLGYTIGNDVSERTWQFADPTWWRAKNSDTFKPIGPWIETDVDVDNAMTIVRLNGKVVSEFRTGDFIFGVAEYISAISQYITLVPGDTLWMGTDLATLPAIKPGDKVDIDITGIGTLSNPVIADK